MRRKVLIALVLSAACLSMLLPASASEPTRGDSPLSPLATPTPIVTCDDRGTGMAIDVPDRPGADAPGTIPRDKRGGIRKDGR